MKKIKLILLTIVVVSALSACSSQKNHEKTAGGSDTKPISTTDTDRMNNSDGIVNDTKDTVHDAGDVAGDAAHDAGNAVGNAVEGTGNVIGDAVEGAGDVVGGAAKDIGNAADDMTGKNM